MKGSEEYYSSLQKSLLRGGLFGKKVKLFVKGHSFE